MKTSISITGQINGNHTLKNAISTFDCELKKLNFNNYQLIFETKKEAVNALSKAFQKLKNEEPQYYKEGGISYSRANFLHYDASSAIIESNY